MNATPPIDQGKNSDWGRTSEDYARFRPGPPPSFYEKLRELAVGLEGQRILDLATGTGVLARHFASAGGLVSGTDISPNQIRLANKLAQNQGLNIDFRVAAAEQQPYTDHEFNTITANQCWLYFDEATAVPEVKRLLKPGGALAISHFSWLPREDKIARLTEELVLKFNPQWTGADYFGTLPILPPWAEDAFKLRGKFYYDEPIPFTIETWKGRIRACRGIGASLTEEVVRRFDTAHDKLLKDIVGDTFTVLHRIDAHVLELI